MPAVEIEELGRLLCASIAAGRYEEARLLVERCGALHRTETHHALLTILEKARETALVQRSITAERLAHVHQASHYSLPAEPKILHAGKG